MLVKIIIKHGQMSNVSSYFLMLTRSYQRSPSADRRMSFFAWFQHSENARNEKVYRASSACRPKLRTFMSSEAASASGRQLRPGEHSLSDNSSSKIPNEIILYFKSQFSRSHKITQMIQDNFGIETGYKPPYCK